MPRPKIRHGALLGMEMPRADMEMPRAA